MDAICETSQPRWHCLITYPQRETQAERWLDLRGVYSFFPVKVTYKAVMGQRRKIVSRYLPGYVFAQFPGEMIAHRVLGTPFIRDAIRLSDGRPGILNPDDLRALHRMRDVDEHQKSEAADAKRIKAGQKVRLISGVMAGQEVEVLSVSCGRAKFRIGMFGAEREAEADMREMEAV